MGTGDPARRRLHRPGTPRLTRKVLSDGQPLPPGTRVTGRDPVLHFLADNDRYRLRNDEIPW